MARTYQPGKFTAKQLARHLRISISGAYEVIRALDEAKMLERTTESVGKSGIRVWFTLRPQNKHARMKKASEE